MKNLPPNAITGVRVVEVKLTRDGLTATAELLDASGAAISESLLGGFNEPVHEAMTALIAAIEQGFVAHLTAKAGGTASEEVDGVVAPFVFGTPRSRREPQPDPPTPTHLIDGRAYDADS